MKYVSLDIETTGLDSNTCQVLEVGAIIDDFVTPIESLPRLRIIVKQDMIHGTVFALNLNARLIKDLLDFEQTNKVPESGNTCQETYVAKPNKVGKILADWLKSFGIDPKHVTAAGKNFSSFDKLFLHALPTFNQHIHFKHRAFDPAILYFNPLIDADIPGTSECCQRAGLPPEVLHEALADAEGVVRLLRIGLERLNYSRQVWADTEAQIADVLRREG